MTPLYFIPTDDASVNLFLFKICTTSLHTHNISLFFFFFFFFHKADDQVKQLHSGKQQLADLISNVIQKCDKDETVEEELWIPAVNYSTDIHSLPQYEINTI